MYGWNCKQLDYDRRVLVVVIVMVYVLVYVVMLMPELGVVEVVVVRGGR